MIFCILNMILMKIFLIWNGFVLIRSVMFLYWSDCMLIWSIQIILSISYILLSIIMIMT